MACPNSGRLIAGFYDEMQEQGVVMLTRTVTAPPDPSTPWIPGEPVTTVYPLDAVMRRVFQKYVDGTLTVATDNQITFAVPSIVPAMDRHTRHRRRRVGHEGPTA
ncbi:hypothetical protein, partial [Mesorhizobium sp.]|uniref:hypothetical protein n=1 Tax=Mesorhizobium sp. TaxID=1871066 RepID=UPI0025E78007